LGKEAKPANAAGNREMMKGEPVLLKVSVSLKNPLDLEVVAPL
jgi:hypothetical protein